MITDKQFNDSFTAAGGWFFLNEFEFINNWTGDNQDLIDKVFIHGWDGARSGTSTRVSSALRIIRNHRAKEALIKIRDSQTINRMHPNASSLASKLIKQYFS